MSRAGWLAAALAAAWIAAPARAEPGASDWAREDQAEVRLISSVVGVGAAPTLRLGLHFRLAPGWKIYWRVPGDAGAPPRADWTGSANLADAEFRWPAPERSEAFGLESFGYGGEVVLPIEARLAAPGRALDLAARLDYFVCERICIPYEARLALAVPAGPAAPSDFVHLIGRFNARVPVAADGPLLAIERAAWSGGAAPALVVEAAAATPFGAPDLFVEGAAGWSFGRPTVARSEGGLRATLRLPARADGGAPAEPVGAALRLTLVDGERAGERVMTVARGAPSVPGASLAAMLAVALLGGLILNLMPCVLPVLALKLAGAVGRAGAASGAVRATFLATAAGILASFLALAGGLVALQAAGHAVGWGIQFQSPLFLAAMASVLTLFAANLWGWFRIGLPARLADAAAAAPAGGRLGAFLTGVFATLLATPCSAPFVGTAVGFALARGPAEIAAIFAALGLGLAAPYLAVAAAPGLATRLPRPGRWMAALRAALGVALLGTALWLGTVIAAQVGAAAAGAVLGLCAAMLAALWALRDGAARWRVAAAAALALAALAAPATLARLAPPGADAASGPEVAWRRFAEVDPAALARAGQVVLVDVTAEWCLTCKVNKALVLARGEVAERLASGAVVAVRADWTRPDAAIARYLAGFGRYGIPFNAVYGPAAPGGIALPELLTSEAVLDAFARAGGPPRTAAR